jgi:phosphonate transport system permease protein
MESKAQANTQPARPPVVQREQLLRPWPPIGPREVLTWVALTLVLIWSLNGSKANPVTLAEGLPNIIDFITRLFPPRFDLVEQSFGNLITLRLPRVVPYIVETLQMAIVGTLIGIVLSLPFALLAARNVAPYPWVYSATRLLMNINRAIPDIIFALIFVAAVGLGPFGGVLALGFGAIGTLGKLYAEAIEQIDPEQVKAVRATGAGPLQTFRYGVVPQALPLMAAYSLLLFEGNVRSATILGLVGAGGVGFILQKYISLFQYRELMGALIFIIVMVTVIDRLSDYLRKKLI